MLASLLSRFRAPLGCSPSTRLHTRPPEGQVALQDLASGRTADTGLAADSWFAGGTNPRPARRIGAVAAMLAGAFLGALLVLHSGPVWPLVVAAVITILLALAYAAHPTARQSADPKLSMR